MFRVMHFNHHIDWFPCKFRVTCIQLNHKQTIVIKWKKAASIPPHQKRLDEKKTTAYLNIWQTLFKNDYTNDDKY